MVLIDLATYYGQVAAYYDQDAEDYQSRYFQNPILQRIRKNFREITEQYPFNRALEIGCGPGFDLVYFGRKYPQSWIHGIDISPKMVTLATTNLKRFKITNVTVSLDSLTSFAKKSTHHGSFDLIYCYFGALNTEPDLNIVSTALKHLVSPSGRLVLTFVNKWYLLEIPMNMMMGRFSEATSRLCNRWKGYSPTKELKSFPRSVRDIKKAFQPIFHIDFVKGYSILHLPWFSQVGNKLARRAIGRFLWTVDEFLNLSPLKFCGEYTLYVMRPK